MAITRSKDIVGKRFNKLVVISRATTTKYGNAMWLCRCDCGNEVRTAGANLRSGNTKSCGCLRHKNLLGKKFGRLKVLSKYGIHKGRVAWNCLCDCGNTDIFVGSDLTAGNTRSCGCLQDEHRRNISPKGVKANKKPHYDRGLNVFYHGYKKQAKDRGLDFDLSFYDFKGLVEDFCFYCGSKDTKHVWKKSFGSIDVCGVDRLDSSIGYVKDNCVSCCKFCNYAKRSYSVEEFKEHISKIYNYFIKQ